MKVLIAVDSFKGSISSVDGSKAISLGIQDVLPDADIVSLPLADGGEGTVEAIIQATQGILVEKEVTGPLQEKIMAKYGISGDGDTAIIEVAAACGLPFVPKDCLNPMETTSFGVGQLITDALEKGCRHFIIGLGGSATVDAGVGMLQALGFRFLNNQLQDVGFGGKALLTIQHIMFDQVHPLLKESTFQIACDVENVLYGTNGAAYIFGPQKGATDEMVRVLDQGLKHFSKIVQKELGIDPQAIKGSGAAGGLGAAFSTFLNGKLQSGIELVLENIKLEEHLEDTDFVITGEGKLDAQTSMGKAPMGVAQLAANYHVPVIALAGSVQQDGHHLNKDGITACFSILPSPMSLEEAMDSEKTFQHLRQSTNQIFRLIKELK